MNALRLYLHPRLIAVLLLGFSSGLPRLLVAGTLSAWLLESGVDKAAIGVFALVALPYSFNFLLGPAADHARLPFLHRAFGRRRGWLLLTQALLVGALLLLAVAQPASDPWRFALLALLVAGMSAAQDVIVDAFRNEYLDESQYAAGAAMAVFGYRVGMLVAGAGALALAAELPWADVYRIMAALMLVGVVTVLVVREPQPLPAEAAPATPGSIGWDEGVRDSDTAAHPLPHPMAPVRHVWREAIIAPFTDFAARYPEWWLILLMLVCYRLPDGFIGFMSTPFLLDIGFAKTEVAAIGKVFGFGATTLGMFLGGWLVPKLGLHRALLWFLIFQIVANLVYVVQAWAGPENWMLILTISADNLSAGMAIAAAIAFMMTLTNPAHTATQYALLASLAALGSTTLAAGAGWVAEHYGWAAMFGLSALLGLPAAAILLWRAKALEAAPEAIVTKA